MPHFFDIKNLTPQQQENWDTAKANYVKIGSINVENEFAALSDKEKAKLKKIYKVKDDIELKNKMHEFNIAMNNNGNEKSALFARLLEGKKPLVFRPPTSFSYPWYGVIEDDEAIELTMFEDTLEVKDFIRAGEINIHQNVWKILKIISKSEALVTFGLWEKMGFVWKFYLDKISCSETRGFICAHHDHSIGRITTLKQLQQEQLFQVKNRFDAINLALDKDYADKEQKLSVEKYGAGFGNGVFRTRLESGRAMLEERRSKGLPDSPTEAEINSEVDKQVKFYFDGDITADENGNLFSYTWVLKRLEPQQVSSEIYMEI